MKELRNSYFCSRFSSESTLIGDTFLFLSKFIGEVSPRVPSLAKSSSEFSSCSF